MKALVCEMCSSNEMVKQDGMYVCQHCGTKYSIEEAKKLMVEIDNSKKLNNLYERARKSLEVSDTKHAAEYYKEILDEEPNDWEAYFYSYLYEQTKYTNGEAASVASKLGSTVPPAYKMAIDSAENSEEASERVKLITEKSLLRITSVVLTSADLLREYEGGGPLNAAGKVKISMYNNMRPIVSNTFFTA